jgi:hypothetical protein
MQQTKIVVNGYTDNTPIGPKLMREGVTSNLILGCSSYVGLSINSRLLTTL